MTLRVLNPRHVEGGLHGRHILAILLAFFGVVFVVNGYFLFKAISTHTGVVANEPYRKGLEYNKRISQDLKQSELNWKDNLVVGHDGRITLELLKQTGEPIKGLLVSGTIARPVTSGFDKPLSFKERATGYFADVGALADGSWIIDAVVRATESGEPIYRLRKRIWLKP